MTLDSENGAIRADTVLVVDDEPDVLTSVSDILENALHEINIVQATTAATALGALREGGIDVIIADYRMSPMDGLAMLKEAKRIAPDVPRILMTAYGDLDVAVQAINHAEVHRFFRKPFDPQEVIDTVWSILDQHWELVEKTEAQSKSLDSLRNGSDHENDHHKH